MSNTSVEQERAFLNEAVHNARFRVAMWNAKGNTEAAKRAQKRMGDYTKALKVLDRIADAWTEMERAWLAGELDVDVWAERQAAFRRVMEYANEGRDVTAMVALVAPKQRVRRPRKARKDHDHYLRMKVQYVVTLANAAS